MSSQNKMVIIKIASSYYLYQGNYDLGTNFSLLAHF